ncbi:MAG: hypothetical protein JW779_05575 [Candidatus Thorarchaeota archaeon]|nr:hypothetical protein [Candidatus Thorarchaeota archaeon]
MSDNQESLEIAVPSVTIEIIGKVVRGLYSFKKPAGYKDLKALVSLHEITVSQGLNAAKDLGLAKQTGGRGIYELTETGMNFARLLSFGKESECRLLLAKQIMTMSNWSEVVSFLEMNVNTSRNPLDLVMHVEGRLGKMWKNRMRSKVANSYRSILEYAGLIEIDGNDIVSVLPDEDEQHKFLESEASPMKSREKQPPDSGIYSFSITQARIESDYSEFSIPEFFIVFVKKTQYAIKFFQDQIKDGSVFSAWLETLKVGLKNDEQTAMEVYEDIE